MNQIVDKFIRKVGEVFILCWLSYYFGFSLDDLIRKQWIFFAFLFSLAIVWKLTGGRDSLTCDEVGEQERATLVNLKSFSNRDYKEIIGLGVLIVCVFITAVLEGKKKETAARQQQERAQQQEQALQQEQAQQQEARRQEQAQKSAWVAEQTAKAQSAKDALNKRLLAIRLERATKDDPQAQFDLALQYLNGQGVVKDLSAAKEWLRKAASLGHNGARNKLAELQATVGSPL